MSLLPVTQSQELPLNNQLFQKKLHEVAHPKFGRVLSVDSKGSLTEINIIHALIETFKRTLNAPDGTNSQSVKQKTIEFLKRGADGSYSQEALDDAMALGKRSGLIQESDSAPSSMAALIQMMNERQEKSVSKESTQKFVDKTHLMALGILLLGGGLFAYQTGYFGASRHPSPSEVSNPTISSLNTSIEQVRDMEAACHNQLTVNETQFSSFLIGKCLEEEWEKREEEIEEQLELVLDNDDEFLLRRDALWLMNAQINQKVSAYYLFAARLGSPEAFVEVQKYLTILYLKCSFEMEGVQQELESIIEEELKISRGKPTAILSFIFDMYAKTVKENKALTAKSTSINPAYQQSLASLRKKYPVKEEFKKAYDFIFNWYEDPDYTNFPCETEVFESMVQGLNSPEIRALNEGLKKVFLQTKQAKYELVQPSKIEGLFLNIINRVYNKCYQFQAKDLKAKESMELLARLYRQAIS